MKKIGGIDFSDPLDDGLKSLGFTLAEMKSPPIDHQAAAQEEQLDEKTGYNTFGVKLPSSVVKIKPGRHRKKDVQPRQEDVQPRVKPEESYFFQVFPEDSQAKLR